MSQQESLSCSQCGMSDLDIETSDGVCPECGAALDVPEEIAAVNAGRVCIACGDDLYAVRVGGRMTSEVLCLGCAPATGVCPLCGSQLRSPTAKQCPECKKNWHLTVEEALSQPGVSDGETAVAEPVIPFERKRIRVKPPNSEEYLEFCDDQITNELYDMIISGDLPADCKAMCRTPGGEEGKTNMTKGTLREMAKGEFKLDALYRPVWAYTWAGLKWGAIVGVGLKLLDTAWLMFSTDPLLGGLFVGALLVCIIPKIGWVGIAAFIFFSIKFDVPFNPFLTLMISAAVGAILGLLPGMSIGTLVGLVRAPMLPKAPDAEQPSSSPLLFGLLLPLIGGVTLILLWIFWLTPMLFEAMAD